MKSQKKIKVEANNQLSIFLSEESTCEMCKKEIPPNEGGTVCSNKCAEDWSDKYLP